MTDGQRKVNEIIVVKVLKPKFVPKFVPQNAQKCLCFQCLILLNKFGLEDAQSGNKKCLSWQVKYLNGQKVTFQAPKYF